MTRRPIADVVHEVSDRLLAIPGVLGLAESRHANQPTITVYVAVRTPALVIQIPSILDGYPVVIEETGGDFHA